MKLIGFLSSVLLLVVLVLPLTAAAQQDQQKPDQPSMQPQASDQQQPANQPKEDKQAGQMQGMSPESELLSKMHMANQMDIKAGQLAESKGTTQAIRNFGALLVRDHSYADKRIINLAKQQGVQLMEMPMPKFPDEKQKMDMQKQMMVGLEQAQGADFDRQFVQFNLKAHEMAVNMVSMGSEQLKPSPVKTLTNKMVPILKQYGDIAQHLEQREVASR